MAWTSVRRDKSRRRTGGVSQQGPHIAISLSEAAMKTASDALLTTTTATSLRSNLNVPEAATELRVSSRTVRNLIRRGQLRKHHIGRRVLISREALDEFIRKCEAAEMK